MLWGLEKAEVRRNTLLRGSGKILLLGVLWPDTVSVLPYTAMVSIAHQLIPNKLCWMLTSDGLNGVLVRSQNAVLCPVAYFQGWRRAQRRSTDRNAREAYPDVVGVSRTCVSKLLTGVSTTPHSKGEGAAPATVDLCGNGTVTLAAYWSRHNEEEEGFAEDPSARSEGST